MRSVFPELGRADHARLAARFRDEVEVYRKAWIDEIRRAEKRYGDHGPLISAGLREHWPAKVKDRVRRLAHGGAVVSAAAHAHQKATKLRSIPR